MTPPYQPPRHTGIHYTNSSANNRSDSAHPHHRRYSAISLAAFAVSLVCAVLTAAAVLSLAYLTRGEYNPADAVMLVVWLGAVALAPCTAALSVILGVLGIRECQQSHAFSCPISPYIPIPPNNLDQRTYKSVSNPENGKPMQIDPKAMPGNPKTMQVKSDGLYDSLPDPNSFGTSSLSPNSLGPYSLSPYSQHNASSTSNKASDRTHATGMQRLSTRKTHETLNTRPEIPHIQNPNTHIETPSIHSDQNTSDHEKSKATPSLTVHCPLRGQKLAICATVIGSIVLVGYVLLYITG